MGRKYQKSWLITKISNMKEVGDTKDFDSYQANTIKRNFNEWTTSIEGKNQSWLTYP